MNSPGKTPKCFMTWLLYMGMVQDLVYSVRQFGFFPQAKITDDLSKHISHFCEIYESAIISKHNEGTGGYDKAMTLLQLGEEMMVLKGIDSNKIPTDQKFWNSASGVNVMNHLPPHECRPSFTDITLIWCHKCYLTPALLSDKGKTDGLKTLTRRAYIGNMSTNKIGDQTNVKMLGNNTPLSMSDFERASKLYISRYQELVDSTIGGQRRTTLNTAVDDALKNT